MEKKWKKMNTAAVQKPTAAYDPQRVGGCGFLY